MDQQLPLMPTEPRARPERKKNKDIAVKWMRSETRYASDGTISRAPREKPKPWPPPPVSLRKLNQGTNVLSFTSYARMRNSEEEGLEVQSKAAASPGPTKSLKMKTLSRKVDKLASRNADKNNLRKKNGSQLGSWGKGLRGMLKSGGDQGVQQDRDPLQLLADDLDCSVNLLQGILEEFHEFGFDSQGLGSVTLEQARPMLRQLYGNDLTEPQILKIWEDLDEDKSGEVTFSEIMAFFLTTAREEQQPDDAERQQAAPKKQRKAGR